MRSGPRPLNASRSGGRRTEAWPEDPKIKSGSPAIATTENSPQHVAMLALPPPLGDFGAWPSS